MLYIRTDGNLSIGTGHIMRCLSVAAAVRKRGEAVTFIVADNHMSDYLTSRQYPVIYLDSIWNNLEAETDKMVAAIKEHSIKKLLIDSYFVTHGYLKALCDLTYVIYMDDLNAFHYPCDMLINYNCYAEKFGYPSRYSGTKLLLGTKYAPLREEFQNLPQKKTEAEVSSILVTVGGADSINAAGKIVKMMKTALRNKAEAPTLHVVSGKLNPHISKLSRMAEEYGGVAIYQDLRQMSELMLSCDLAVSAAGSTLYELCACGTPSIAFSLADNQAYGVSAFGEGYMINTGDIRENEKLCLEKISDAVTMLSADYKLRCEMAKKARGLVDGQGALRLAQELATCGE